MPNLPKVVRDRLAGTPAIITSHPDPDLLTAFLEGTVSQREREQVVAHLAACGECRQVAALAAPEMVVEQQLAAAAVPKKKWWNFSVLRWAAVSATAVVLVAVGMMVRSPHRKLGLTSDLGVRGDITTSINGAGVESRTTAEPKATESNVPADHRAAVESPSAKEAGQEVAARDNRAKQQMPSQARAVPSPSAASVALEKSDKHSMMAKKVAPAAPSAYQSGALAGGSVGGVAGANMGARSEAPEATIAAGATRDTDVLKASRERAKTNAQLILDKERKDEVAVANRVAAAPAQQPAAGVGAGSAGGMAGPLGPTPRPGVELMSTPTSIPHAKLPPVRWTIDAAGELQRSADLGKTWQVVPVDQSVHLQALAVLGSELWTGGTGGALYHSQDGGFHWLRVQPQIGNNSLQDDITRISLPDAQHVTVATASSVWNSADGGRTWQKQ